jgi:hypothetical protein
MNEIMTLIHIKWRTTIRSFPGSEDQIHDPHGARGAMITLPTELEGDNNIPTGKRKEQRQCHPLGWVPVVLAASGAQDLHDHPHDD